MNETHMSTTLRGTDLRTWRKFEDLWRCLAVNKAKDAGLPIPRRVVYR